MKKTNLIILMLVGNLIITSGCLKNKLPNDPTVETDEFSFKTTNLCDVSVDYKLSNYSIMVELYAENPLSEVETVVDGQRIISYVKNEKINPVLRAITDKQGKLSDVAMLSKEVKTVYCYTQYLGVPSLIPIEVKNGRIEFSLGATIAGKSFTKSATASSKSYPDNLMVLGDWDQYGVPNYLAPRVSHPEGLLYNVMTAIPEYSIHNAYNKSLDYLNKNHKTDLDIVKKSPINLIFAHEGASMQNAICYYHYPTGSAPTSAAEVQLIVAFPNSSYPKFNSDQPKGLSSGDNVNLKYWNKEKNVFEDEFPAGTTIGFAVMSNSFKNGNITHFKNFYSTSSLNTTEKKENQEHVIALFDQKSNAFVYLFEDVTRTGSEIEGIYPGGNFHDAIVYLKSGVEGAISTQDVTELSDSGITEPSQESNFTVYEGTLIFEDLWPSEGDYDMNDIVIEYESTVYRNNKNRVIKLEDNYTLVHRGGQLDCGFGYQLEVNRSSIASVTTTPVQSEYATDDKGLELGQAILTPSILLFKNCNNLSTNHSFTVTTLFGAPEAANNLIPPYNPFIIINSGAGRGQELHLTNFKPTSLVDLSLFGMDFDVSDPDQGKYYISKNKDFPFAINLPIKGFKLTDEKERIDKKYPNFTDWVESKGARNNEWYIINDKN